MTEEPSQGELELVSPPGDYTIVFHSWWRWLLPLWPGPKDQGGLFDFITDAFNRLWNDVLSPAFDYLWTGLIKPRLDWLWDSAINPAFTWLWNTISSAFATAWSSIQAAYTWLWNTISAALSAGWAAISGSFAWLWNSISGALKTTWNTITGVVFAAFGEFFTSFGNWAQNLWTWLVGFFTVDVAGAIIKALSWLKDQFVAHAHAAWDFITGLIGKFSPITPDQAPAIGALVFGFATFAGFAASAIADAGEIQVLGSKISTKYIAGFLGELSGWGRITAATLGVIIGVAVSGPMRYYVQKQFRPAVPDPRLASTLFQSRDLSLIEYRDVLAHAGFSEHWIDRMLQTPWRPVAPRMLIRIAQVGEYDKDWFREQAEESGVSPPAVEAILRWVDAEAAGETRTIMAGAAMKLYREGWIMLSELVDDLRGLGVPERLIGKYQTAAIYDYAADYLADVKANLKEATRRGVISPDEMEAALTSYNMVPERAKSAADLERIRLLGPLVKPA